MRVFEVVLISANLLTLFLRFKKQSKLVWLGAVGINITVFFIHGIFEGFRYQMAFSYIFVILLVGYTLVKINHKFLKFKTPKRLKVVAISLAFLFIVFTSFLSYALPVFTLPKPTGSSVVGIKYFHLVDENRYDPFLNKSTKKRELMVKIYYPAKKDDSKPFSHYFHTPKLIKAFASFYNMPDFMFDHLNLVKTNSKENLQLEDREQSYPVVLFSHGAGTTMEVQTSQSEDLASNGYFVVDIDHTYVSSATAFPNRIVSSKEATTDFNTPEPAENITQIMADDSKFVIDSLKEINEGKINSNFKDKLNLDKIGAIGHSVGGAVAYNLAINDGRVKAAIDLDGTVFITPKDDYKDMAPFLMLANDKYHIQAIQNQKPLMKKIDDMTNEEQKIMFSGSGSKDAYNEVYKKASQNMIGLTEVLKASGNLYTIVGSDHMKFIDIGLFIGSSKLRELMSIGGKTEPSKCLEITKSLTVAFFDQHLKSENKGALKALVKKYTQLKKVNLK